MELNLKKQLEKIFRDSTSSDELFDAFQTALANNINEPYLFEAFLWNKSLSSDEIIMFAEKLSRVYPYMCYDIYMWTARIFESSYTYTEHIDNAVTYYRKAANANPSAHEPYSALVNLYNPEIDYPSSEELSLLLKGAIENVVIKSKICFALASLYQKIKNIDMKIYYIRIGEKYLKAGM
jgi:hypothetical protein